MIHLTRLNNQPFILNADLIKFIENSPDTVITLLNNEKLVVRESSEEVLERIHDFQRCSYRRIGVGTPPTESSRERAPDAQPSRGAAEHSRSSRT